MNEAEHKVIEQTKTWIKRVVIDCNFCPFAAKPFFNKSIRYVVKNNINIQLSLDAVIEELSVLDKNDAIETTFIIFENTFLEFNDYLALVKKAEALLVKYHYDGVYQLASFHPDYCFAGSNENDASNYTNRSVYPMLHILREDSITKALALFKDAHTIPENNINFAQQKGLKYMQLLKASCM